MAKKLTATNLPVIYMKEGDTFICYSPAFDLVAHGDSFEDAEESFAKALKLFIQEVTRKGTWEKVLREYGWEKVHKEWCPPRVIGQENVPVELPIAV
jgi:predicted RNase H-like HicB family nuclease